MPDYCPRCRKNFHDTAWVLNHMNQAHFVLSSSGMLKQRVLFLILVSMIVVRLNTLLSVLSSRWVFWFRQQRMSGNKNVNYEEGIKKKAAFSSVSPLFFLSKRLDPVFTGWIFLVVMDASCAAICIAADDRLPPIPYGYSSSSMGRPLNLSGGQMDYPVENGYCGSKAFLFSQTIFRVSLCIFQDKSAEGLPWNNKCCRHPRSWREMFRRWTIPGCYTTIRQHLKLGSIGYYFDISRRESVCSWKCTNVGEYRVSCISLSILTDVNNCFRVWKQVPPPASRSPSSN